MVASKNLPPSYSAQAFVASAASLNSCVKLNKTPQILRARKLTTNPKFFFSSTCTTGPMAPKQSERSSSVVSSGNWAMKIFRPCGLFSRAAACRASRSRSPLRSRSSRERSSDMGAWEAEVGVGGNPSLAGSGRGTRSGNGGLLSPFVWGLGGREALLGGSGRVEDASDIETQKVVALQGQNGNGSDWWSFWIL